MLEGLLVIQYPDCVLYRGKQLCEVIISDKSHILKSETCHFQVECDFPRIIQTTSKDLMTTSGEILSLTLSLSARIWWSQRAEQLRRQCFTEYQ